MSDGFPGGLIIESKPGAATRLAVEYVKNSLPDGTTMLFTPDFSLTLAPFSFKKLNYDPIADFSPVATVNSSPLVLCVGPSVPETVRTPAEYIAWCRLNPNLAAYASSGAGAAPHFTGVMFSKASDCPLLRAAKRAALDEARMKARSAKAGLNPGPGAYDVKRPAVTAAEVRARIPQKAQPLISWP
jgi:tripartite-type tricarboxylate transporter receptor subunit TctC